MKTNMALLTLLLLMPISLTSCNNSADEALTGTKTMEVTKVKASFLDEDNTLFDKATNTYKLSESQEYFLVVCIEFGNGSTPIYSVPMEDITITSNKNNVSCTRTFLDDYVENQYYEKDNKLFTLRANYFLLKWKELKVQP